MWQDIHLLDNLDRSVQLAVHQSLQKDTIANFEMSNVFHFTFLVNILSGMADIIQKITFTKGKKSQGPNLEKRVNEATVCSDSQQFWPCQLLSWWIVVEKNVFFKKWYQFYVSSSWNWFNEEVPFFQLVDEDYVCHATPNKIVACSFQPMESF